MERLKDLSELWNWLPAFRAVGETEHLPSAGSHLSLSPAALSRSIALLERSLGKVLFDRRDRRLRLNASGRALLEALREAMDLLEEGLDRARDEVALEPVRVCSGSQTGTSLLVSALEEFRTAATGVGVEIVHPPPGASLEQLLLQGSVDVVVHEQPQPRAGLRVEELGAFPVGIYCGVGHPLFKRRKLTLEEVASHPFVGPPATDGAPLDDWPAHVARRVAVRVPHIYAALGVVAQGRLVGVLPDRVVRTAPGTTAKVLRRLPLEAIPPTPLFASRRVQARGAALELIGALRAAV